MRKLTLANEHSYHAAELVILNSLPESAKTLIRELEMLIANTEKSRTLPLPSLGDLTAELIQIDEEFDEWGYEWKERCLWVQTDPIELEGIHLGVFRILLDIRNLTRARLNSYTIEAMNPNCAAGNSTVTHPHVSDGRLCTGDGGPSIHNALRDGRLGDFFMLIRSVLNTYNSHSPYVRLDEWEGIPCHECGYTINAENITSCPSCENDFCNDCLSYCRSCDENSCCGCLNACTACGDSICSNCMGECSECGDAVCDRCLREGLCPSCRSAQKTEEEENNGDQSGGSDNSAATVEENSEDADAESGGEAEAVGSTTESTEDQSAA